MSHRSPSLPLFKWLKHRAAGVLLHPTCFPGDFGVGTFGPEARHFVDFLHDAGFSYWQLCPLGPTSYGDSPYQCPSAFAGNPYLIDLPALVRAKLLKAEDLGKLRLLDRHRVDYGGVYHYHRGILRKAFEAFRELPAGASPLPYGDFEEFKRKHARWLDAYALFMALKDHFGGKPWTAWPAGYAKHRDAINSAEAVRLADHAEAYRFYQYLFFGQWRELRAYAAKRGISIIGDIPIFAALDSADVWAQPHLFEFDAERFQPIAVAGCPPDYFSADGQYWGNPLYDWNANAADGYRWWLDRLAATFELCDVVRIDHFRGFESYWRIPAESKTARTGAWVPGPGLAFFKAVKKAFPDARIIAEDLGTLTPEVIKLRDDTGLPGMAVLQFAFGGKSDNLYLPHNLAPNSVVYPGTHDNDTTRGWYSSAGANETDHVRRYFRVDGRDVALDFVRAAFASVSRLAVLPLQDLMNLGSEARFNTPGKPAGNWGWRYSHAQFEQLRKNTIPYLREIGDMYRRLPEAPR
jgi:4-alpha-glucanotransferase